MRQRRVVLGLLLAAAAAMTACAVPVRMDLQPGEKVTLATGPTPLPTSTVPEGGRRAKPLDPNQPAQIESNRMQYQDQGQVTLFTGNVKVNQESAWLFAPTLEVHTRDGLAFARGGVRMIDHYRGITLTAGEMDYRRNLADVEVRKNVQVMTRDDQGQPLRIRCEQMAWNTDTGIARAWERVMVHYQNITATAGEMQFSQEAQTLLLTPAGPTAARPEIIRGWDRITGERITLKIKEREYEVEGSARAVVLPEERRPSPTPVRKEQAP